MFELLAKKKMFELNVVVKCFQ